MTDVTLNRYNVITFPDNDTIDDIVEGIVDGSLNLDEMLFSGSVNYGEINANKFEASIYNLPDVVGEKIQVYQMDNGVKKYLFTGYVDSCKLDEYAYYRNIIAYDLFYKCSGKDYDISEWWSNYWSSRTSDKIGNVMRAMLNYFNIPYININLPLDNYLEIKQSFQIQQMSVVDMLQLMCALNMCVPNVNRQGYVEFILLNNPNTINIVDNYAGGDSEFEAYSSTLYDAIKIYNENGELVGSYGNGTNVYEIRDNMLVYDKMAGECDSIAEIMYPYLCQSNYIPASIEMIVSNFDVHVGDIVHTSKGNHLVCEQEYHGTLLIDQSIKSNGESLSKSQYGYSPEYQRLGTQIASLSDAFNNRVAIYLIFDNEDAYEVSNSNNEETIISIDFNTNKKAFIVFHTSVIFTLETNSSEIENIMNFDDGDVSFQFYINNEPVIDYVPKVTYQDGTYTIHLDYSYYNQITDETQDQTFQVVCRVNNCTVIIPTYRIHGYLTSDGLYVNSGWDGRINVLDEIEYLELNLPIDMTDSVEITTRNEMFNVINQNVNMLSFNNIIPSVQDTIGNIMGMVYTTIVNISLLTYTATITNNTFTAGDVITTKMNGITGVDVTSQGDVTFTVSFDNGATWKSYVSGEWIEGTSMTVSEIESIPSSAWNNNAQIKATIADDGISNLKELIVEGGTI